MRKPSPSPGFLVFLGATILFLVVLVSLGNALWWVP